MQFYRDGSGKAEWYRSTVTIAHYRTFLRQIKKFGFNFRQSRKKGLLTSKDLKERLKFAKTMSGRSVDYWSKDVAFYLDGLSFVFKGNSMSDAVKPKSKVWRKKKRGLGRNDKR